MSNLRSMENLGEFRDISGPQIHVGDFARIINPSHLHAGATGIIKTAPYRHNHTTEILITRPKTLKITCAPYDIKRSMTDPERYQAGDLVEVFPNEENAIIINPVFMNAARQPHGLKEPSTEYLIINPNHSSYGFKGKVLSRKAGTRGLVSFQIGDNPPISIPPAYLLPIEENMPSITNERLGLVEHADNAAVYVRLLASNEKLKITRDDLIKFRGRSSGAWTGKPDLDGYANLSL